MPKPIALEEIIKQIEKPGHNLCIFLDDFGFIFKVIFEATICPKTIKKHSKFLESVQAVVGSPLGSLLASFWPPDVPRQIVYVDIVWAPFPQEAPSRVYGLLTINNLNHGPLTINH